MAKRAGSTRREWRRPLSALAAALAVHAVAGLIADRVAVRSGHRSDEPRPSDRSLIGAQDAWLVPIEPVDPGMAPSTEPAPREPQGAAARDGTEGAARGDRERAVRELATRDRTDRATNTGAPEPRTAHEDTEPAAPAPAAPGPVAEPGAGPTANGATPKPIDLGIGPGGWTRWMKPGGGDGAPGPESAPEPPRSGAISVFRPQPRSTTGGVQEALEAHDREIGLGPSGPVRTAFEDAAHLDIAPQLGSARFVVTVLRSGVVEVALAGVTDQASGWNEVGARAAEALRRKLPRLPASRKGVRMTIELQAAERLVNGAASSSQSPRFVAVPPSIRTSEDSKAELKRRNPVVASEGTDATASPPVQANVDQGGIFLEGRSKVCSYRAGLTPTGPAMSGGCDPSNIGTKPLRVVSARVIDETML